MPSAAPAHTELSLSRINRLLRPLRTRCAALAAGAGPTADPYTRSRIAGYAHVLGEAGEWADNDVPPLAVLPHPKTLVGRAALHRRAMLDMPAAKLIYGVIDAWKNILQAALPVSRSTSTSVHIMSLRSICAAVVGGAMVGGVGEASGAEEGDAEDSDTDAEGDADAGDAQMVAIQELYEAIPTRLRCWTLISHSLTLLLATCPHNPTLLHSLLELTHKHGLARESRVVLYALLVICVQPASAAAAPPLSHPAHTEFLKELCSRWTSTATPALNAADGTTDSPASANPHFSTVAFIGTLVSALIDTRAQEAWTCKATARFARQLRQNDAPCYVTLCAGLVDALAEAPPALDDDRQERLALWLDSLSAPSFLPESDEHVAVLHLLCAADKAGLNDADVAHLPADSPACMLRTSLVCSSVRCLIAPALPIHSYMHKQIAVSLRFVPVTVSLTSVITSCFAPAAPATPSGATSELLDAAMSALQTCAAALRTHALHTLETSLWTSALVNSDNLRVSEGSDGRASRAYRQTLLAARAAAEQRRATTPGSQLPPRTPQHAPGSTMPARVPPSAMRFQSVSTTTTPAATPKKSRKTRRTPALEHLKSKSAFVLDLEDVARKLLVSKTTHEVEGAGTEHEQSDSDAEDPFAPRGSATPRARRVARAPARRIVNEELDSDDGSGSDWTPACALRSATKRRSTATPRARRRAGSDLEDGGAGAVRKRKRGADTPQASRRRHVSVESNMDSSGEDSGSDWVREDSSSRAKGKRSATAKARGKRAEADDSDVSGSDWERDNVGRASTRGASAPMPRRARAASRGRKSGHEIGQRKRPRVEEVRELSSPASAPQPFRSKLAHVAQRRISLHAKPAARRRGAVLDSDEDSSSDSDIEMVVDVPTARAPTASGVADSDESDIEIVVDVPVQIRMSNTVDDDALNLFMYA